MKKYDNNKHSELYFFICVYTFILIAIITCTDIPVRNVLSVTGGSAILPCPMFPTISDDRPLLVLWFKDGSAESIYSYDARTKDFMSGERWQDEDFFADRAFFSISLEPPSLKVNPTKNSDDGIYTCRVEYIQSPSTFVRVNLSVLVPPHSLTIYWDNKEVVGSIGPLFEGNLITLICMTKGGIPTPEVTWQQRGRRLETITEAKFVADETVVLCKTVVKATRELHSVPLICQAKAPDQGLELSKPKTASVTLNMILPPLTVKIIGVSQTLMENTTINPTCISTGSYPPAEIIWFKNDKKLTPVHKSLREGGNVTKVSVTINVTQLDNGKTIKCQASNPAMSITGKLATTLTDALTLNVQFKPRIRLKLGRMLNASSLIEGKDAFLECKVAANPPPHKIEWLFNNEAVIQKKGIVISGANLGLQKLHNNNSGNYQCAATNLQGKTSSQILNLEIRYAPICVSGTERIQGAVIGQSSKIICRIQSDPIGNVEFQWSKILPSGREMNIPVENVTTEDQTSKLRHEVNAEGMLTSYIHVIPEHIGEFGKFLCRARNRIGFQTQPCLVTLISAGPPDPPFNCTVIPGSETIAVECREGFNGGFPQVFHLEAWIKGELYANSTSYFPSWTIEGLTEGIELLLNIRSTNPKGLSQAISIVAHMPIAHQQSVTEPEPSHTSYMGLIIGSILGAIIVVFLLFIVIFVSTSRHRRRGRLKKPEINIKRPDVVTTSVRHHHRRASSPDVDILENTSCIDDDSDNDFVQMSAKDVAGHPNRYVVNPSPEKTAEDSEHDSRENLLSVDSNHAQHQLESCKQRKKASVVVDSGLQKKRLNVSKQLSTSGGAPVRKKKVSDESFKRSSTSASPTQFLPYEKEVPDESFNRRSSTSAAPTQFLPYERGRLGVNNNSGKIKPSVPAESDADERQLLLLERTLSNLSSNSGKRQNEDSIKCRISDCGDRVKLSKSIKKSEFPAKGKKILEEISDRSRESSV